MKKFYKLLFVALLCSCPLFSIAQQGDTLEIQRNQKGVVSYVWFKPNPSHKMQEAVSFLEAVLQAKPEDEFRLLKDTVDGLGITHQRYQQYYKGIRVDNAEYLIHGKNGIIEVINGDFQDVRISSVAPITNEQQALSNALSYVNAQKYKWEDEDMESSIKRRINNPLQRA